MKVEHLQIEWAESWFDVKTKLEKMSCNFITYEEYRNICLEENVGDKSSQNTLVDFLNDLGVIVHFKDISLLDTHVLEPKWITEGVYKIINSEILARRKEFFDSVCYMKFSIRRKKATTIILLHAMVILST